MPPKSPKTVQKPEMKKMKMSKSDIQKIQKNSIKTVSKNIPDTEIKRYPKKNKIIMDSESEDEKSPKIQKKSQNRYFLRTQTQSLNRTDNKSQNKKSSKNRYSLRSQSKSINKPKKKKKNLKDSLYSPSSDSESENLNTPKFYDPNDNNKKPSRNTINLRPRYPKKYDDSKKIEENSYSETKESYNFNLKKNNNFIKYDYDGDVIMDEESTDIISQIIPNFLPCRKDEQDIIYNYIKDGLQTNGNYSSLYIAGMPGTGKTACVNNVINILEKEIKSQPKKNKKIPCFNKLYICGMDYPIMKNLFKTIHKFIFVQKKRKKPKKYIQILDNFFKNRNNININDLNDPTNSHILLIVDELDFLINRSQNFLYNIFNWTTYENSKLIVISISNTLDLPNRLQPKIKSRMGNNRIMFKPYNKDQLFEIIKSKGIDYKSFSIDALKLSSIKVAAVNGDLRRIIKILNKAKEIFLLKKKKGKIGKEFIIQACDELFNSKFKDVIKSLQISEKIIIAAILSKIKDDNKTQIGIETLYNNINVFIGKYNESQKNYTLEIHWDEFKRIIYNLERIRLINFEKRSPDNFTNCSISISFYIDEFINACTDDNDFNPVLDYLLSLTSN